MELPSTCAVDFAYAVHSTLATAVWLVVSMVGSHRCLKTLKAVRR